MPSRQDARRRRQFPLRSQAADRDDAESDDDDAASRRTRARIPSSPAQARELLNKWENERSGVLSTAMSFLGLYRDPVVAQVTRRCDWRIRDLVDADKPATLYLVVPPSDISRTKPLVRLILNQIGRRLTEELDAEAPPPSPFADARRVPGAGPARFLRKRARLHGGLWAEELSHRAVAQSDREGLWAEQLDSRQLPCARELRDQ